MRAAALALASALLACGGADAPAATGDAGTRSSTVTPGSVAFLERCAENADCATGLCFSFNQADIGKRCSKTCSAPSDCPSPSTGCNGMGVCKHH